MDNNFYSRTWSFDKLPRRLSHYYYIHPFRFCLSFHLISYGALATSYYTIITHHWCYYYAKGNPRRGYHYGTCVSFELQLLMPSFYYCCCCCCYHHQHFLSKISFSTHHHHHSHHLLFLPPSPPPARPFYAVHTSKLTVVSLSLTIINPQQDIIFHMTLACC